MPSIMAVLTFSQYIVRNGSLFLVAATFSCMKTLEYSLRGAVTEMVSQFPTMYRRSDENDSNLFPPP